MDLKDVFIKQEAYFKLGYTKSITFRELQLNKLLKMLKDNEENILIALEKDLGNSFMEGYTTELGMLYSSLRTTIKNLHKWSKPIKKKTAFYMPFSKAYVNNVAFGNVLIMSAFNYPLLLSIDPLIGALAAGNTAMVSLPQSTPKVNKIIIEMLNTTFDADYVYAFITNRKLNNEVLTFKFNKIFYTGSSEVGKIVLRATSKNLIPTTLELGGKSPAVVTKDANIKNAADSIVWGKLINAGKTCVAPDYLLVDEIVVDELIIAINLSVEKMYGKSIEENSDYSKLVNAKAFNRLLEITRKDKDYIVNNFTYSLNDLFMSLVIIKTDLDNVDKLASMTSEIFGPILPIIVYKYQDLDSVVDYINNQNTPLAFYPFSTKSRDIKFLLDYVRFGGASVNDTVLHLSNLNLPFGGLGNSGMGNYHGKYSFETFSHKQAVLKTSSYFKLKLMYPPYSSLKYKLVKLFFK